MEGQWKFLVGRGVLKTKFLESMYENKLSWGDWGARQKKPSVGGVLILPGTAHYAGSGYPVLRQYWDQS